jgi:hypothetical protein
MRQFVHFMRVYDDSMPEPQLGEGFHGHENSQDFGGYILEQAYFSSPPGMVRVLTYRIVLSGKLGGSDREVPLPRQSRFNGESPNRLQLRPVGRLVQITSPIIKTGTSPIDRSLKPIQSGQAYRITSPPASGLVIPELAEVLENIFERFACGYGFSAENPLEIQLARGFQAASHGHAEGRAVDIAAMGGRSLFEWKQEWERTMANAEKLSDTQEQNGAIVSDKQHNLGYGLYKALQEYGGWRLDPKGWLPYRGVVQLFGPWTATEGPWKEMKIKNPNLFQQQRLRDQQWVFQAHQDHIHVAK